MGRRARRVALVVLSAFALGGGAHAATYPSPPPDFAHPGRVHYGDPYFSRLGGQADRPILVVYVRWDDVDYPAGFPASVVSRRFFGTGFPSLTFPSVGDYFRRLSFNDLFLFPAAETQGVHNDGVVQVHYPGTKAQFGAAPFGVRNKKLLELADPFVDFEALDLDSDGKLTDEELVFNAYEAAPETPLWQGCGIQRHTDAVTLDGTALGSLRVAMTNTSTNLMTIVHENAHVALGMKDLYGFDTQQLDIAAATCEPAGAPPNDEWYFAPNAWHKLHWGWITPTVVTQDGYHEIRRADTTGDAFILYDPERGTDDYFVVENRTMTPGSYDEDAGGRGLVIWRIADNAFGVDTGYAPIGVVRTGGFPFAAWNGALAPDQRTMTSPWMDGTDSRVAVRAIGAAGDVMRAYFDVRGPGILVDTFPVDRTGPVQLTAGAANTVDVPIMNTGESGCDTFVVEAVGLPAGWTSTTGARILCAGESSFARFTVTPDAAAAVAQYPIRVAARSLSNASVASDAPLSTEVVLRPTRFGLGALVLAAATGTMTTFEVVVSGGDDPLAPRLAGVSVTFTLSGPGGTATAQATTGADGVARTSAFLGLPPGTYALTIETARFGAYAGGTTTVPYTIERRPTTLVYTGSTGGQYSDPVELVATLVDALTGSPLEGRDVAFEVGPQTTTATTAAGGSAATMLVLDQPAAALPVEASFAGDETYLPSTASKTFAVAKERLSFAYTGDTLAAAGAPTLAARATEEDDGSPGDLTRAAAVFTLVPWLGAAAVELTAHVAPGGTASTSAPALAGDAWQISISVPATNGYWEGTTPPAADSLLAVDSGACGNVAGGLRTAEGDQVQLSASCRHTEPRTLQGMFQLRGDGASFRADDVVAYGVSDDQRRAYAAGRGTGGAEFVLLVEDGARADAFHAWLDGRRRTGAGTLASGNITIAR